MKKQKVVRTNASISSAYELKVLLNDGYKVVCATRLSGDVIEYIVEKEHLPVNQDFVFEIDDEDSIIKELEEALTESEKTTEYFMNKCREQEELVYDQEEAARFIHSAISRDPEFDFVSMADSLKLIKRALDIDEEYMRNKGIIED